MNNISEDLIQLGSVENEQRDYLSQNLRMISNIFFICFFTLFFAVYRTGL